MTNNDLHAFDRLWQDAMSVYGKSVDTKVTYMVFQALVSFPLQDIELALKRHMTNPDTGQFPPKPADIVKHIRGNSQSSSGEAWAKVDYAIRCVGPWRSVVFDDPKIHAAIERLGGWQTVANSSGEEYPFVQNKFVKLYQGFTVQPPDTFPRVLIGTCEHQNSEDRTFRRGTANDAPALIGNKDRARLVYQGGKADMGIVAITHEDTAEFLSIEHDTKRIGGGAA